MNNQDFWKNYNLSDLHHKWNSLDMALKFPKETHWIPGHWDSISSMLVDHYFGDFSRNRRVSHFINDLSHPLESDKFSISFIPSFFLFSFIFAYLTYMILIQLSKKLKMPYLVNHNIYIVIVVLLFFINLNFLYMREDYFLYNSYYIKNTFTSMLSIFISVISLLVFLVMNEYNKTNKIDNMEYYTLFFSSIFALVTLLESNEMISFFFLLELQSITSYILAGFNKKYKWTLQSGIKYFIIGGVSSIFVALGLTFIYSTTGSTSFEDIKQLTTNDLFVESSSTNLSLGIFFITVGFFGKFYVAPFHWWILDVYEGSPTTTTLYFATVPLFTMFYVLYKIYFIFFSGLLDFYIYYFILGCYLSMIIGSIGALLQKRLKRLVAYSSINMIGYMFTIFLSNNVDGFTESINLFIPYTLNLLLIFLFFYNGRYYYINNKKINNINYIEDFYLLRYLDVNKYSKYILAFGLYGILGLPPMPLFFQKLYLLENISIQSNWFISFFFVLSSMVSGYYYLYVVKELFYHSVPINSYRKKKLLSLSFNKLSAYLMSIFFFLQFFLFLSGLNPLFF